MGCGIQLDKEAFLSVSADHPNENAKVAQSTFFYGWVVVAASTAVLAVQAGMIFSFGVFFKQLVAHFGWSRAATSGVFSMFMISHGAFAIAMGWFTDRFGPTKVMVFCGFMVGLGLVLSSLVNELWQLYVTYGLIVSMGVSGGFPVTTSTTARWFTKQRGLALGIVVGGTGLGTLIMLPIADHLINVFGWSMAYFMLGVVAWVVMIPSACFLKRSSEDKRLRFSRMNKLIMSPDISDEEEAKDTTQGTGIAMKAALRCRPLWLLLSIYSLFNFSLHMVMVHLVNYATDLGIASPLAATFVSTVGAASLLGRMTMGIASDRIGSSNALLICCTILAPTLVLLIFAKELWMFYLFAVTFGFAYGGEVPQIPALIGRFFGLRAVAALIGVVMFGTSVGGALGSWVGGQIFDVTQSYQGAFTIALIASLSAVIITVMLKKVQ